MIKIKAQTNPVLVQQTIEDYLEKGPAKVENSDNEHFTDSDSRGVLNTMRVRELYNSLKEQGSPDDEAWKKSGAGTSLPLQEQLRLMREIKKKNPNFYSRARSKKIFTASARDLLKNGEEYWDFVFDPKDLEAT